MKPKISLESKITLIELPAYEFGRLNGKLAYDEFSFFKLPSRALPTLEAVLREEGYKDTRSINPIFHGDNGRLSQDNFKRIFDSSVLMVSYITRTALQSYELAQIYKKNNPEGIVVFGGPHSTFLPEEALNFGDIVVFREGEITLREMMKGLIKDKQGLDDVKGIAFKRDGKIIYTPKRELMSQEELSRQPVPYYDEDTLNKTRVGVLETTRGCPHNCNFCTETKRCGNKYRMNNIDKVMESLKLMHSRSKNIFITDNNFTANPIHVERIAYEIKKHNLDNIYYTIQGDVRGAEDRRISALNRMNVKAVCLGLESNDNEILEKLRKPFLFDENIDATKKYMENNIWVHGMFMMHPEQTRESLRKLRDFSCRYTNSAQFAPLIPLPGSDIRPIMEKKGLIISNDWYLYDGHHVLLEPEKTGPDNLDPYEMQVDVKEKYQRYWGFRESLSRIGRTTNPRLSLLLIPYTVLFGGVSKIANSRQTVKHFRDLKERYH